MRGSIIAVMASALSLTVAAPAVAADAVVAPPSPPEAQASASAPLYIWAGPYGGAFVDYDWTKFDADPPGSGDGAAGGLYGGYNWQQNNFVFGLEGDVGYSGAEGSTAGVKGEQGFFGSLRARAGIDFNPFLLYATGGVAATDAKVSDPSGSDSNALVGWTAGAGAETALTDKVTARIEYRYTDYGKKTFDLPSGPVSSGFDEQSVRAGIGIKF